jgi:methionyl aminopeptidase
MILIKNEEEIKKMRRGAKILAQIMQKLIEKVRPGISTKELDEIAEKMIIQAGATPSFKNYNSYPSALCTAVNNRVVHAIPSGLEILCEGDIIGLDLGIKFKGLYTDMARTVGVGRISEEAKRLIMVTEKALAIGAEQSRVGRFIGDISAAVQKYVEGEGFGVVRKLVGHGVGREIHEDPRIPNFGEKGTGDAIHKGMTICIEPMVTEGSPEIVTLDDGWTVETADGGLAAHFEDTILVTDGAPEILTR